MTWAQDRMDRAALEGLERISKARRDEIASSDFPPQADLGDGHHDNAELDARNVRLLKSLEAIFLGAP